MKTIFLSNADLTKDKRFTYLTEDVFSGASTIRVQSILGFESLGTSSGQITCLGEIGNERTELKQTSSTTGPSATYKEITLASTLSFDHPQDTKVSIVDWNRADIRWSATVSGAKSTLEAYPINLQPDQLETLYNDTQKTSGYYFVRFNETVGNTYSDYTDPIAYGGFDDNSVYEIKSRAVSELNEEIDGKVITHDFLNKCLWEARREYHQSPGKRPFRRMFNSVIGTALTGSFQIELPTDVEKPFSAENVYGVRIGTKENMLYIDKKEFDTHYENVPRTFLTTAYAIGDQDLYCSNVRDLTDSGAVTVEGTSISYSARGISGGTLRISSAGAWACSVGSNVWQNASYGLPTKFTVFATPAGSAYIYFNCPIDTAYVNQNIHADYYRTILGYDSDGDILDEPAYDMYVPYLKAMIKYRKSNGSLKLLEDDDYKLWLLKKSEALAKEYAATEVRISPNVEPL